MRLRLATRASRLALAQSTQVAEQLMAAHDGLDVELVHVVSTGDKVQDKPLHDIGGKGLFTKEVELALLAGEADFAVHSYKDVPVTMPLVDQTELVVAAVPKRAEPSDCLVIAGDDDAFTHRLTFPHAANANPLRIGTGSLRRRALFRDVYRVPLEIVPLRGNVDTRLGKVASGELDAVLLASAGLKRLGNLHDFVEGPESWHVSHLEPRRMVPAPAQGALALQCRADRDDVRELLAAIHHSLTAKSVEIEREVVRRLDGDCTSPIGAYHDMASLYVAVGADGGERPVHRFTAHTPADVAHLLDGLSAARTQAEMTALAQQFS
ncbi:MAG: hydroxymethylbilane synthase [Planctomycetota bacterium]